MTSQNDTAENLMREIEKAEEADNSKNHYHLCIINLVIGTLYCSKGNYEFGISRVIKSLDPVHKKLSSETWFYAHRCFLALFEVLAKQLFLLKDSTFSDVLNFLDLCQIHGQNVSSFNQNSELGFSTIRSEARKLKFLFLSLYD
jgi:tetratricopeptide repeat protein 30